MKKLTIEDFLRQYDKSIHDTILDKLKNPGVKGVVTMQCIVLDSSRCGLLTALFYGDSCTFKSISDISDIVYITGLPSSAASPINYTEKD